MFPVPKSRLRDVCALLAEPTADSATAVAEEAVEVPDQGTLTLAMISKLQVELNIPAIQSLLTRLAQQAPQPLTFKEAVQAAGVESNNLRAQLGSLTKIT